MNRPRPDWRDPDMPVHRNYRLADGTVIESIDPAYETGFRAFLLETNPGRLPNWREDPTYNLKRKR
jgi:hypothetical protein